jgi:flagellar L-ring protein precursor FlgH
MKILILTLLLASAAAADSLLSGSGADLYTPRPLRVGDLVTVLVVDKVNTIQSVQTTSQSQTALDGPAGTGLMGFLPGLGFTNGGNSERQEVAASKAEFSNTITARVVGVDGDVILLEAANHMDFDGRERQIALRGRVRRQDVLLNNTVSSDRLADLRVFVDGVTDSPVGGGFMSFILGLFR